MTALLRKSIKQGRRVLVAILGFLVILIGIAMIVFPGPAIIVIPIGLGILASEFRWARTLLKRARSRFGMKKEAKSQKPFEKETLSGMERESQKRFHEKDTKEGRWR